MKLTKNFSRSEAFDWYKYHGITGKNEKNLKTWQKEDLNSDVEKNIKNIALKLQQLRDKVNEKFPEYKGDVSLKVTSWFRPVKWEKFLGRTGTSMHTKGHAVDIIVSNTSQSKVNTIMDFLWEYLSKDLDWNGGLARSKKFGRYQFIHIDLGRKRRWTY